jgi:hypothetical protein
MAAMGNPQASMKPLTPVAQSSSNRSDASSGATMDILAVGWHDNNDGGNDDGTASPQAGITLYGRLIGIWVDYQIARNCQTDGSY